MTIRLSYSQLSSLTTCGEQFRLERVVGVTQRPAWALIGGSTVHEVTELHDLAGHGVAVPSDTFREVFERRTVEAEEESGIDRSEFRASGRASARWPNKEDANWWLTEGPAMVQRWVNWTAATPWKLWITPDGKPAVEIEFDMLLNDDDIDVKGFIDRVYEYNGYLIVLDIKTGSRPQPTPRQLGTYKVGLEQVYGDALPPVAYGAFWDGRRGVTSTPAALNEYDERRLSYQYGVVAKMRRENLYLPSPGPMCSGCSVNEFCFEYTQGASAAVRPPWVSVEEWEGDGDAS